MTRLFRRHYTRDEARALLPQLREWLGVLRTLRQRSEQQDQQLRSILAQGDDAGGPLVHRWIETVLGIRTVLREFQRREIQIKDVERGLIDFPALRAGREVFLCWEMDEDDVEYWHEIDSGYAGRERLS